MVKSTRRGGIFLGMILTFIGISAAFLIFVDDEITRHISIFALKIGAVMLALFLAFSWIYKRLRKVLDRL